MQKKYSVCESQHDNIESMRAKAETIAYCKPKFARVGKHKRFQIIFNICCRRCKQNEKECHTNNGYCN